MILTKQMLFDNGACGEQTALFGKRYPNGVHVTKALCVQLAYTFDFRCAALPALVPGWERACAAITVRYKAERIPIGAKYYLTLAEAFGTLAELIED